jgi:hypothetical protein
MSLSQVRHTRCQRPDEVLDTFGWAAGRWHLPQVHFKCHADDVRRSAAEAAGRSPEGTTQRAGQTDRDLIIHEGLPSCALQLLVQCIAISKGLAAQATRPP